MTEPGRDRLREIKTFPSLVKYLRDELDWPIESDDFDDLTFDYQPEELGIDAEAAAKIKEIKQLRPLSSGQPWGIFFINFEPKRLPVVVLRRVLRSLVIKKRQSARKAEQPTWHLHDLLFISSYGQTDARAISFANFSEGNQPSDLPTLRVLAWDSKDTVLHLGHAHETLKEKLCWPEDQSDHQAWQETWSSAFVLRPREVITTSKKLAVHMAGLATQIRNRANTILGVEAESGPLRKLHKAFQEALIHDLSEDDFADMYAQTITYGFFAAACSRPAGLVADNLADMVPVTNPFLKELLATFLEVAGRKGHIDFDELGVNDVVQLLLDANLEAVKRDFGDRRPEEDPVIHFYELFLTEYDRKKKIRRGVFYTPQPVVSFIVRSVHEILQTGFGLEDGLADTSTWDEMVKRTPGLELPRIIPRKSEDGPDVTYEPIDPKTPFVQILDPACGTGTFLVEVIDLIHKTMVAKWQAQGHTKLYDIPKLWNDYVPKNLLPRLYGFELMMAPYTIAHMKLGLKLGETGYRFASNERLRVYLTNSLEPPHDFSDTFEQMAPVLAHEARAANSAKGHTADTVLIGNPPYSKSSANQGRWIESLMEEYKRTVRTAETQIQALSDDYVKFIRMAEASVEAAGVGVLAFISNNGYTDGPIFRDMRDHLRRTFSTIQILDLHGDSRKKERSPDGGKDENVFDIQQGVAISVLARCGAARGACSLVADLWGARGDKYSYLAQNDASTVDWDEVSLGSSGADFKQGDETLAHEWDNYVHLYDVFGTGSHEADNHIRYGAGFVTQQDEFAVAFQPAELLERVDWFLNDATSEQVARTRFRLCTTNQWDYARARRELDLATVRRGVLRCQYRPFDYRYTVLDRNICTIVRQRIQRQFALPNIAMLTTRRATRLPWSHVFVTSVCAEYKIASHDRNSIVFPLNWYPPDSDLLSDGHGRAPTCAPNINPAFLLGVSEATRDREIASDIPAGDAFHYLYAILHAPSYRSRYGDLLTKDFARIPIPATSALFATLASLGANLTALHLLEDGREVASWNQEGKGKGPLSDPITEFVGSGGMEIGRGHPKYDPETQRVSINSGSYFECIPEEVWNFQIGGYQVCQKWLKDRGPKKGNPGRVLTDEDIAHYQKIVVALNETIRLMAEIDKVIDAHGGWPDAFLTDEAATKPK